MNSGYWKRTTTKEWAGLNYIEAILDFDDLPEHTYGKLKVEWADDSPEQPGEHEIEVRLSYQQQVGVKVPFVGSNIRKRVSKRWQLDKSEWFKIPPECKGMACLWVEGRCIDGGQCAVALATVALEQRDE